MADNWLERWNTRYREETYAYGTEPNEFLKTQLGKLKPGKILFPAEGEGRNAVYAAKQGWEVTAFDISEEGKKKALQLAEKNQVSLDYRVGKLPDLDFGDTQFDAIGLVFAHFPPDIRAEYHRLLDQYLKPGGTVILEAFGKNHLEYREKNPQIGGPQSREALFSVEEMCADFSNCEIVSVEEREVELNEGLYHVGTGSVVRMIGHKRA